LARAVGKKRLWHSHHYEVKSGELVAPGIPNSPNARTSKDLVSTYGKTFHTWQVDRDEFPYDMPQLIMGFTQDGQIDEELVEARDRRFGIPWLQRRERRVEIPIPSLIPGANS
jgi:hypothetical protein